MCVDQMEDGGASQIVWTFRRPKESGQLAVGNHIIANGDPALQAEAEAETKAETETKAEAVEREEQQQQQQRIGVAMNSGSTLEISAELTNEGDQGVPVIHCESRSWKLC